MFYSKNKLGSLAIEGDSPVREIKAPSFLLSTAGTRNPGLIGGTIRKAKYSPKNRDSGPKT